MTIEVPQGSSIVFAGQSWNLDSVLLRIPSEHLLKGQRFAGELQFRHTKEDGEITWVAILLEIGSASKSLRKFVELLESLKVEGDAAEFPGVDLRSIVPRRKSYFYYSGSDTFPPCVEGRQWVVMQKPVSISLSSLDRLEKVLGKVVRPVQPLGARTPLRSD